MVILSGGNVDAGLLAEVARRHESQAGRRLVLLARLPDRPGSLARLLVAGRRAAARTCSTSSTSARASISTSARRAVQLVLETRGRAHAEEVIEAVAGAGYRRGAGDA